jgi:DNA-binding CsgD family transcriptional regulator
MMESLSPAQQECLRLVAKGRRSKEIAKITGYAPATVDIYVSKAVRALGVRSRREAALLFLRWEREKTSNFIFPISAPRDRIDPRESRDNTILPEAGDTSRKPDRFIFEMMSLPPIGGKENELNPTQRLQAALKIAMFSAIMIIVIALIISEGIFILSLN